jgi:uncharacterized protein YdeI (YjbR/CyaY-like superfamily)
MSTRDPRVDAYIQKQAEFARPILERLREAVHKGCPDVTETVKWSMPFFMRKAILCHMAAFKAHCSFGFWKGNLVVGKSEKSEEGMGQFGRIESLKDLPSDKVLIGYVKKAVELDEAGVKREPKREPRAPIPTEPPADLAAGLKKNKKARETFEKFRPSHKREYIEWITEAKREETRQKRLAQTLEWLTEGKSRHWKHQNC